jgi:hypothetical protein
MKEIHQLREQLTYLVNTVYPQDEPITMNPNLQPPSPEQVPSSSPCQLHGCFIPFTHTTRPSLTSFFFAL